MDYEFATVVTSVSGVHILSAKGNIFPPFSYKVLLVRC